MKLKQSEAKVLVLLENAVVYARYAGHIAAKLGVDYGYMLNVLRGMHVKGWIQKTKPHGTKTFYSLNTAAPLKRAKELLSK